MHAHNTTRAGGTLPFFPKHLKAIFKCERSEQRRHQPPFFYRLPADDEVGGTDYLIPWRAMRAIGRQPAPHAPCPMPPAPKQKGGSQ